MKILIATIVKVTLTKYRGHLLLIQVNIGKQFIVEELYLSNSIYTSLRKCDVFVSQIFIIKQLCSVICSAY